MKTSKLLASLLSACLIAGAGNAMSQTLLKVAYVLPVTSHYGYAVSIFKEEVSKRTSGRYQLQEYASGQLGGERELVEGAQLGTIDLVLTSTGPITNFVPDVGILDIPFLFRDAAHAHAVLDGKVGQDLLTKFPGKGLIGLAWADQSFRHLTNNKKPVLIPADARGLKVRTMENPVHILAFKTMGAHATPMAFPEVFAALQQGTIDGQEQPIPGAASTKMYQVQKHLSLTGHFFSPALFIMSPKSFNALSAADKEHFKAAAKTASTALRAHMKEADQKGIEKMKAEGVQVVENIDKSKFEAAMKPAYAEYAKKYGQAHIEAIRNFK